MEKIDKNNVAMLTGVALQDDETFQAEGGFVPERDQFYFEMKQDEHVFLLGFKDMLLRRLFDRKISINLCFF